MTDGNVTTWRRMLEAKLGEEELIACTLTDDELDKEFDDGYGCPEGKPFTAWTDARVFFPCTYDGAETVKSVPRNPCDEATKHVGGW